MTQRSTYKELEQKIIQLQKENAQYQTINKKLLKCEEDLDRTQRMTHIGGWHWDMVNDKVTFTKELYHILGRTQAEFKHTYKAYRACIHPDDVPYFENFNKRLLTEKKPLQTEYRIVRPSDEKRTVLDRAEAIVDSAGKVIHLHGMIQDITEFKEMEKTLRQSEERYRYSAMATHDAIYEWDAATDSTWRNIAYEKTFGQPKTGAWKRDHWFELIHPDDQDRVIAGVHTFVAGNEKYWKEAYRLRRIDGEYAHVVDQSHIVRHSDGSPVRVIGAITDITKHILLQQQLRAAKNDWERTFNAISDVISIHDLDGNIIRTNEIIFNIFNIKPEQAIGKKCYEIFCAQKAPCDGCPENQAFHDLKPHSSEIWHPVLNKTFLISIAPIFDDKKKLIGSVHFARDITDQKKLAAQFQQAQKMESIGNLAGGIAHDFNNILSAIMGFSELALYDIEKGSLLEEDLNGILQATHRAKDLVWQILSFARQTEEKIHPVRVKPIAREVLKFIRSSIPSSIEIRHDFKSESLIMGNSTQIHQILLNLCTNAVHAMKNEAGTLIILLEDITITAGHSLSKLNLKPGDYIVLSVSDTGEGVAPDKIDYIFEPYYTSKEAGKGTGLGLSVVHGIVEKYNGKITVNSSVGQGSVFTIYLPIWKKEKDNRTQEIKKIFLGTERILFVDDEALLAKTSKRILESLGYSVATRTSSVDALELFKSKPDDFDLVLTDMTMPNMTGDKLAVELMKVRSDIPVILCTGYSKIISDKTASDIGIKALIFKPIIKEDMAKIIRKVLDKAKGTTA